MSAPDLSILLPTGRRPESLGRLLHRIESCRRDRLAVEVLVLDDEGGEHTREVCARIEGIPVRHLAVPNGGATRRATLLNHGLADEGLGRIVAFTDEGVEPALSWLKEIRDACDSFPDYDVFGGRVEVVWPDGRPPRWASGERGAPVRELGFEEHAPWHDSGPYPIGLVPTGRNFWIRRSALESGVRFEAPGLRLPQERARELALVHGGEERFLRELSLRGHRTLFASRAVVQRSVARALVSPARARLGAFDLGRRRTLEHGLPLPDLLRRSPLSWTALRRLCVLRDGARVAWGRLGGVAASMEPLLALGGDLESLRLAREAHVAHVATERRANP